MSNKLIQQINKANLDKARLKSIINEFNKKRILVIGDLILDEYLIGNPSRISREAPVIILKYLRSKYKLGGSSNAADNIASLGAKVTLCGILGEDQAAIEFQKLCAENCIELLAFNEKYKYTTVKTRVVSTSNSNPDAGTGVQQQVLRIDKEENSEISTNTEKIILEKINELNDIDLILLSDYSNGVLTQNLATNIIQSARERKIKTIVDSNGNFAKFKRAYSLTPNQPDLEKVLQRKIENDDDCANAGTQVLGDLDIEVLLTTRGGKGMCLTDKNSSTFIPAFNLSEVFDVSGAGDTVAAAYSLSLASGASPVEAAIIGNLAASIVVKKYGTATTNQDELFELIDKTI